jgi:chitodextrinase
MNVVVYPQLSAQASASPSGSDPSTVSYVATASGGDGRYLAYQWRFSDGTTSAGARVTHQFPAGVTPGAVVTVTDGSGGTAAATA